MEILRIDELRKLLTEQLKDALFPTPVDLLKLKDFLLISDAKWKVMEGYFNLPTSHRLWKLRELRKNLNDEAGVSYTTSGHGSTIGITKLIGDMIRKDPPSDASQPITLKFAFDACRITSNVEEVIGTISKVRMDRQSKSPENASQFIVWIGAETYNEYKQELAAVRDVINGIVANPSLTVDGTSYTLDPYLVLDMKSLCVMLGLYEVYRSNCKFRCCWCHCTKDKIGVFNIDSWSFRSIAQMKADAELNKTPSTNYGIKVSSRIVASD